MAAPLHQWANGDPMSYVLVVDDQETVRDLLCRYLEGWDFDAHATASAMEALATMETKQPAIAILDLQMPGKGGLWLAEQMHQRWPHTAIIIVSADSEGARLHSYDHIVKPFDREQLRETVTRVARRVQLSPKPA
jgi:CheY-like chemotaxis protein